MLNMLTSEHNLDMLLTDRSVNDDICYLKQETLDSSSSINVANYTHKTHLKIKFNYDRATEGKQPLKSQ